MSPLIDQVQAAVAAGKLLPESARNIAALLGGYPSALYQDSLGELVAGGPLG